MLEKKKKNERQRMKNKKTVKQIVHFILLEFRIFTLHQCCCQCFFLFFFSFFRFLNGKSVQATGFCALRSSQTVDKFVHTLRERDLCEMPISWINTIAFDALDWRNLKENELCLIVSRFSARSSFSLFSSLLQTPINL